MRPNIVIIGFENQFNRILGKSIADKLDMFFVDVSELVEYNLISSKDALIKCGQEYIDKEERKTVMSVAEFENSVAFIEYDSFVHNYKYFGENNLIVYIVPKSVSAIDEIVFEERDKFLREIADIVVKNDDNNVDNCFKKIVKALKG